MKPSSVTRILKVIDEWFAGKLNSRWKTAALKSERPDAVPPEIRIRKRPEGDELSPVRVTVISMNLLLSLPP
jgi:hypothetical protein